MTKTAFPIDKLLTEIGMTLMCLFAGLFALSGLQKNAEDAAKQAVAGDILVNAEWTPGSDADVDLWVKGPGDEDVVGFNHRADKQSSYLRDDVGMRNDFTNLNYEIVGIRGLVPGRYVVNLHLFALNDASSAHVMVVVTTNGGHTILYHREVDLIEQGQEVTAVSFVLDSEGHLVVGSTSETNIPIVTAPPQEQPQ
jgi:hypothetical protein